MLSFGHPIEQGAVLLVSRPSPSFVHPEEELVCDFNTEQASDTPKGRQERRGDVASWRSFAEHKVVLEASMASYTRWCLLPILLAHRKLR